MMQAQRFSIKHTDYGILFFDEHEKKELSLKDVLVLLNDFVPPKLPAPPAFLDVSESPRPPSGQQKPIVMDGNNASMTLFGGMGSFR